MAARRDEPTRVAPHGAPGTRAICDSSIVPLGLRGPFLNALRVDQSDLKQALMDFQSRQRRFGGLETRRS